MEGATLKEDKARFAALLAAAALVGFAVVARVWLAATGGYSGGTLSAPLRVTSAVALFVGLALAAVAVAWPVKRARHSTEPKDKSNTGPRGVP